MESQLPAPRPSGEIGARNPQVLPPRSEIITEPQNTPSAERPATQELPQSAAAQPAPMLPPPSQTPQLTAVQTPVLNPLATHDDTPSTAADDEVIEKEWVDKAKKIISQTKDDPYQQEKQVSKLQADYLKKRYGKDIKITSD